MQANRFLTEKEEESIVSLVTLMSSMGIGLTKADVINVINTYINLEEDEREAVGVSDHIFEQMKKAHTNVLKVVLRSGK